MTADANGAFSFDVTGLTPPFMLKGDEGSTRLYALTLKSGTTELNALTTAVLAAASDRDLDEEWSGDHGHAVQNVGRVMTSLRTVLAPLFQHYGVKFGEDWDESRAYRTMLREVNFVVRSGVVTVTNKATGAVIFTALLSDLASGVLHPENIPGGAVTPPPPAACVYVYSAWGACLSNASQTRTVTSSSPAGCTGTTVLSQACVYTPPVIDGAALYAQKCANCHGPLATSSKKGRTAAQITAAGMTMGLSAAQVQALATVLVTTTPPPTACTYTTGAWGACQPSSTQTRTVTAAPAGCTGTPPASSQSCTYVPPVTTCSSFTYSGFGACQSNNTQVRTVASSSPSGCTGGTPVLTQSCTYVPPITTCSSFTYSAFGACQSNNTQTRSVTSSSPSGCTGGTPVLTQACTYVPPVTTCSSFTYSAFGACQSNNTQVRTVTSSSPSGCTGGTPVLAQSCTYVPPVTTCSSFTYSGFGACQSNNTQVRTVTSSSPSGCTGGTPVLAQACTYTPPLDGTALYNQYCSGCHGNGKKGASASATRSAISSNKGGMGSLSNLTTAQLQAISSAP